MIIEEIKQKDITNIFVRKEYMIYLVISFVLLLIGILTVKIVKSRKYKIMSIFYF